MAIAYEIPELIADFGDPGREIQACRDDCALFDFSFVHRAVVTGPKAQAVVEAFASRDLKKMTSGKIRYALRLRENETLISDLTIWKMSDEHFEVMSGHPQDIRDLSTQAGADMVDLTPGSAIFAIQGPSALERLAPHCTHTATLAGLGYFEHALSTICGTQCQVGRLGYTGEAGFELICSRSDAAHLWSRLAEHVQPAGFIAVDTLRIEAGFPLFWNDFVLPVTAPEAGLGSFSSPPSASPSTALKRICFSANSERVPRLWRSSAEPRRPHRIGEVAVTSACFSARAQRVLGLGYVLADSAGTDARLYDQDGTFTELRQEALPFYDFTKSRPRAAWR